MLALAVLIVFSPLLLGVYSYVAYPAILWLITRVPRARFRETPIEVWPSVTVTVPVYNAASNIRRTLQRLIELDYPRELIQILVMSDASTDGTDDVVREFAAAGVELVRSPERRGKTAAENAAVLLARGEIIVNVDATVEVPPASLKRLVAAFVDPSVGVASGRDVSVSSSRRNVAEGEVGYTGFEMWVRDLETAAGSIVGASGCFFAIRRDVHRDPLPPELSWDFASVLIARKLGYRSISVSDAVCLVPFTGEMRTEFRRKSRTMARGLSTLFHFAELMNPFRYGSFALMLLSHKLLRWLPYLLAPFALLALLVLASQTRLAAEALAVVTAGIVAGVLAIRQPRSKLARTFHLAGFAVAVFTAGFLAWYDALRGERKVTWNPTPRATVSTA
jgi:cellulose synthase/poly-beta-1,6-N-acetylglucosamine synthase-like glycosyltransferase